MQYAPGDEVLIRASVSSDGRTVIVAPGAEISAGGVDIVTDIPVFDQPVPPVALLMFFASEAERSEFAAKFNDEAGIETRDLETL